MHAERDHLVRAVFPELKKLCRERQVYLTDVDLRWGVSEKDAQDGKALDICLNEIDTCRPYFLGLFGHRYGWIPFLPWSSRITHRPLTRKAYPEFFSSKPTCQTPTAHSA